MLLSRTTPVTPQTVSAGQLPVKAPLVHPLHPLNASFASFRDVWSSPDPTVRPKLLKMWRENGHHLDERRLTHAMDRLLGRPFKARLSPKQLLWQWVKNGGHLSVDKDPILDQVEEGSIEKARPKINKINPGLLENGTAAEVFDELCGINAIQEFAVKPAKKSFLNRIPPVLSIATNEHVSGFVSPFAAFAVAALASSLSFLLPGLFVDTFPKLDADFSAAWFAKMLGFTVLCTYWIGGWKHFFGEIFPKTYHIRAKYLDFMGKVKKYAELRLNEGDMGLDMNAAVDFQQPLRLFDPVKKYLNPVPFFGKFALALPEKAGALVSMANSMILNVAATTLFLYIAQGPNFEFWPALLPSATLSVLFNAPIVSYIVKIIKENGEGENKVAALRQIFGIALSVFAAITSTRFNDQFIMHPALMVASQFLAGTVMMAGAGTFVKPKKS